MKCSACGAAVAADARFCASCGRPLRAVDDERRIVSVVFADLVGFTALSEHLDPERVKNLVDRCFDRMAAEVTSFGGQVDKVVGDAMVALFGAPVAHEDDAERAVRAALRMQAALCEEAEAIGEHLQMRVGVNTGEVLVGAMRAAGSITAMGDVVNTASRLQTAAQPGQVLVGPATYAATRHTIAYEPVGLLAAKGREAPVDTWVAVAPTLPPGYRARRVDVPLLGRDTELGLLRHAVDTSISHQRAQLVLLVADVGMGKSRLADEVAADAAARHGAVVREGRCVPYGEANVWWPVADALREGLGVAEGAGFDAATDAIRAAVATAMGRSPGDPEVRRTAEGLLTLMGYEPLGDQDPVTVRQEAGRALAVYAAASAERAPLILQISDLHWADAAVRTLIDDAFAAILHRPVVVLATARPSLLEEWTPRPGRHNVLVLHLDPLDREAAAELLEHLVGAPVPAPVAEALLDRSGGNPFYLEELVSLVDVEATTEPGRVAAPPDTLRGLVAARLDDLAPGVRAVLQDAAVIGQRGPMVGLREMARQMGRELDADTAVAQLVADEIMELEGEVWAFRSDLVREVAYQTITKTERAHCHLGIARFIEAKAADVRPRPPWVVDQLAHHYGVAVSLVSELGATGRSSSFPHDLADRARRWVVEAADRSRRDQALPTSIRLYTQALDLLGDVDGPNVRREAVAEAARLHLARGGAAAEGWDVPLARADAERALDLAERIGEAAQAARAVVVRGSVEQKEGDLDGAIASLSEAAERFRALDDLGGLGEALRQRGMVEIFGGRLAEAEASAEAALAAFEEVDDRSGVGWASQNLAWVAFVTGRPDEADRRLKVAVELFAELAETQGLAWSLGLLAFVRFQQRRVAEAEALGQQVLDEAMARNDPWATAMMRLLIASVSLWSGRTDQAVALAEQALRTFQRLGDRYGIGQASAVLGRSLVMDGRVEDGFALMHRAGRPDGVERGLGPAGGQVARMAYLASSLQVGDPERASAEMEELVEALAQLGGGAAWGDDLAVLRALHAAQGGDPEGAHRLLAGVSPDTDDPNVLAAKALVEATSGHGDPATTAAAIDGLDWATYLDRTMAHLGVALAAASSDTGQAEAQRRVSLARSAVHATEDRVAQAVVELAAATVARRLGLPETAEVEAHAEHLWAKLGVDPVGWSRVFAAATRTVPVT
jgi:class 3 adenylate cyclase/predicted ATPase